MEEERATKRRKLFQNVLPPKMIENIVLVCPNTIVMQALACTCKHFKDLLAKGANKEIVLSYEWKGINTTKSAEYTLRGDGTAIKEGEDSFRTQGSRYKKSKTALKMFEDRFKFIKVYNEVLDIMNMTDASKFKEIIEQNEDDPLFKLDRSEMMFYITIDSQNSYEYSTKPDTNDDQVGTQNLDLDPQNKTLSWNFLDEKMVMRLKCARSAILIRDYFREIPFRECKQQKSLDIEYRQDAVEYEGWDLTIDDSGHVIGHAFEKDDAPWHHVDEKRIESVQLIPSFVDKTLIEVEKFIISMAMTKLMKKSQIEDDASTNDSLSEDEDEKSSDSEEDHDDDDNYNEDGFQGRRTVKIKFNGVEIKKNLSAKHFDDLMNIIQPVTRCIDTPMSYD